MDISYKVSNLRRIENMPFVPIRPLTILVGKNSAGKSTFLRSFPLLKQSVETRSSAPILWFGDVDFGDFKGSVSHGDLDKKIKFSFEINGLTGDRLMRHGLGRHGYRQREPVKVENLTVEYEIGTYKDKTTLSSIHLEVLDEDISVVFQLGNNNDVDSVVIDNIDILSLMPHLRMASMNTETFGEPYFISLSKEGSPKFKHGSDVSFELLYDSLREHITNSISDPTIEKETRRIFAVDRFDENTLLDWSVQSTTKAFRDLYSSLHSGASTALNSKIYLFRKLDRAFVLLSMLEQRLTSVFSNVGYLGPARARGERYYRKQELQVSEISPDGQNLPMFLASLSRGKMLSFSNYVQSIFDFGVEVKNLEGHLSINLTKEEYKVNVTDTGYGVSQLLPVLGALWWANQANSRHGMNMRSKATKILAIEQPELHLHPEHQALLAEVFASVEKQSVGNTRLRLIVETHSEALINRLGELIESKKLAASAVQIVIFNASDDIRDCVDIQLAEYDDDGGLVNWPYGFFNYRSR